MLRGPRGPHSNQRRSPWQVFLLEVWLGAETERVLLREGYTHLTLTGKKEWSLFLAFLFCFVFNLIEFSRILLGEQAESCLLKKKKKKNVIGNCGVRCQGSEFCSLGGGVGGRWTKPVAFPVGPGHTPPGPGEDLASSGRWARARAFACLGQRNVVSTQSLDNLIALKKRKPRIRANPETIMRAFDWCRMKAFSEALIELWIHPKPFGDTDSTASFFKSG